MLLLIRVLHGELCEYPLRECGGHLEHSQSQSMGWITTYYECHAARHFGVPSYNGGRNFRCLPCSGVPHGAQSQSNDELYSVHTMFYESTIRVQQLGIMKLVIGHVIHSPSATAQPATCLHIGGRRHIHEATLPGWPSYHCVICLHDVLVCREMPVRWLVWPFSPTVEGDPEMPPKSALQPPRGHAIRRFLDATLPPFGLKCNFPGVGATMESLIHAHARTHDCPFLPDAVSWTLSPLAHRLLRLEVLSYPFLWR